jgi:hypothetical protein
LTISFLIIGCGQLYFDTYDLTEFGLEMGHKLGSAVRDDCLWGVAEAIHLLNKQTCQPMSSYCLMARNCDCLLGKAVDDNYNLVVAVLVL